MEKFLQELTKCSQAQTLTSFEEDGGRGRCHRVGARGGSVGKSITADSVVCSWRQVCLEGGWLVTGGGGEQEAFTEWLCCLQDTQFSEVFGYRLGQSQKGVVVRASVFYHHAAATTLEWE